MMDKNGMLEELVSKCIINNWAQELLNIDQRYSSNREHIEKELVSALEDVCRKAAGFQQRGVKGDIKYICISFLRTSIMEDTSFYRIDAYDSRWFLDTTECYSMWNAEFIFSSLFKQISLLKNEKKQYGRFVTDMDVDNVKLSEALKYHTLAVEFTRSVIPKFLQSVAFIEMVKVPEICIMMGEYRDFNEVLYSDNEVKA
ncbi:hypothetical protein [Pseudobacteroides cellulosolvens]|uniref:Uncharacterized protein n=1 Tax=Pseudobacteroides cellulosolvens ATCC 35603 = DSM 2933 TaxID=398512 RepID=A0A0L6JQ86_9FIRM|nr:hypothetical protein [Pseudobacteroides cellulosolvens]KNY27948.1 hypothetical protein Bccel_3219 [Pseudobacteroides cellulosolvens ATCC 35603 = DSM 2933]